MKKYIVKRVSDNKVLSEWKSDFAEHTHYEENWGKPEHQKELTPKQVLEDGTVIEATYETIPSEYALEEIDITAEIEDAKLDEENERYLRESDYIVLKIAEAMILNKDVATLKARYASILDNRAIKRAAIKKPGKF